MLGLKGGTLQIDLHLQMGTESQKREDQAQGHVTKSLQRQCHISTSWAQVLMAKTQPPLSGQ